MAKPQRNEVVIVIIKGSRDIRARRARNYVRIPCVSRAIDYSKKPNAQSGLKNAEIIRVQVQYVRN